MGGSISCESELNVGTKFNIHLNSKCIKHVKQSYLNESAKENIIQWKLQDETTLTDNQVIRNTIEESKESSDINAIEFGDMVQSLNLMKNLECIVSDTYKAFSE